MTFPGKKKYVYMFPPQFMVLYERAVDFVFKDQDYNCKN